MASSLRAKLIASPIDPKVRTNWVERGAKPASCIGASKVISFMPDRGETIDTSAYNSARGQSLKRECFTVPDWSTRLALQIGDQENSQSIAAYSMDRTLFDDQILARSGMRQAARAHVPDIR